MRLAARVLGGLVVLALAAWALSALTDQPHRYGRDAVVVDAPPAAVWAVLTDFERYGEWNPYVTRAQGSATEGSELALRVEGDAQDAEVLIVRPLRKLEWRSRTLAPGLRDHEQIFRVVPLGPERVRVVSETRFEGLLAPFADLDDHRRGFQAMIRALARRAEGVYQSSSE